VKFVLVLALLGSALAQTEKAKGSVCLAPVAEGNDREMGLGNPNGGGRSFNFSVQIDGRERITVSHKHSISVPDLDLNTRHRVRIFRDGKPFTSFSFKFSDYKRRPTKLCLFIKGLYETWQLWDAKDCPWCKCR
jgi:hypothetical protein